MSAEPIRHRLTGYSAPMHPMPSRQPPCGRPHPPRQRLTATAASPILLQPLSQPALFDVRLVTLFEGVPGSRSRALYRIGNWNRAEVAPIPPASKIHATSISDQAFRLLFCEGKG